MEYYPQLMEIAMLITITTARGIFYSQELAKPLLDLRHGWVMISQ